MYSTTTNILDALKAPARQVSGGVYIYNDAGSSVSDYFEPNGDLISFTIERTAPMGKFFGFLVSQKVTIKLIGSHPLEKGRKVQPYYEVAGGSIGIQYFYVEEVTIDEVANTTEIVAYDILQKAYDKTIGEVSITYPLTLQAYTEAVVAALGATLQGNIGSINPTIQVANVNGTETLREILTAITEATGTICYVHSGDKLKFRRLGKEATVDTLDGSQYFDFSTKDSVTLTQVASTTQLGENISYGEEGFAQAIWDNPFLELHEDVESIVEAIGTAMIGLTLVPYDIVWRGNPYYEIGDYIEVKTSKSEESKFIYYINESFTYNGGYKSTANWEAEEQEDIDSTPTSLSAVLKQTYAKVDKVNNEINLVAADVDQHTEAISALQINTENINASVQQVRQSTDSAIEGVNSSIETLTQRVDASISSEAVELQIQKALAQGTNSVTTTTGFTFNEEGLTVSKTGSQMTTQITEDGMTVYRDETAVLIANNEGVEAINLNASTYLIIGLNSRFEDYDNKTRTGCFWIGN